MNIVQVVHKVVDMRLIDMDVISFRVWFVWITNERGRELSKKYITMCVLKY